MPPMEGKGGGGAGKTTDGCRGIVPDEETIVLVEVPSIGPTEFVTDELIADDGDIPKPPPPLFDN